MTMFNSMGSMGSGYGYGGYGGYSSGMSGNVPSQMHQKYCYEFDNRIRPAIRPYPTYTNPKLPRKEPAFKPSKVSEFFRKIFG